MKKYKLKKNSSWARWQRDRAKLDTLSVNVQCYSQNHAQNCIFGPPYGGIRSNI